jgi:hypothetical protein
MKNKSAGEPGAGVERSRIPPLPDPEAKQKNKEESGNQRLLSARQFKHA